ncbi:Thiol-disulfide oxidoreductase ResA [Porphyromonas levii]|nr:Thiol-disulfide oxidoreductase ResA [Porphyromonas levii]MBR8729976.1 Thiol-disulfide oxidoreductase ResA [Porphyromonas levii]MBR8760402.1 Thiol-disulfide oxidoreductase ResA [Porphyromonas levii]MBR8774341.1 Thiol-disulfide oxidoreductase ResA [Porphyromonas levii]MBR8807027.1 Thiol-disulfide oxidoreductase ResA [Porphyromonas levii]
MDLRKKLSKKLVLCIAFCLVSLQGMAQSLPVVKLKDLNGKTVSTASFLEKGKPVILSFFGTWCKPCLRELDAIQEVYEDWQDETGVTLYAISINEGSDEFKVKPVVHAHGWEFPVLLDTNTELKRAMGVNVVPNVIVLDGKGKIILRKTGYVEGGESEIIKAIRSANK